jgi:hypothetical protein
MVLESKACGFVASRTDFSSAACRRLGAVDYRQYRVANEVSRTRHAQQSFLVVGSIEVDLYCCQSESFKSQYTGTDRKKLIPKRVDL